MKERHEDLPVLRLNSAPSAASNEMQQEVISLLFKAGLPFEVHWCGGDPEALPEIQTTEALYSGLGLIKLYLEEKASGPIIPTGLNRSCGYVVDESGSFG